MTAAAVLKKARSLLGDGIAPADALRRCADKDSWPCGWNAEEVVLFSVDGALKAAGAATPEDVLEAWRVLEQVHAPLSFAADELLGSMPKQAEGISDEQVRAYVQLLRASAAAKETYLDWWLERPWRRLPEVLRLFDLAISRATAREAA